jgi:hypothetical protein
MRDAAMFCIDFFKPEGGKIDAVPSVSPNGKNVHVFANAASDFAIMRELLTNLLEASKLCNLYGDEIREWETLLEKVPETVFENGYLREYYNFKTQTFDNKFYPQLLDAFLFRRVTFSENPEKLAPYIDTAEKIFEDGLKKQSSMSLAVAAYGFFGLGQTESAVKCIDYITSYMMMNNLIANAGDFKGFGIGERGFENIYDVSANICLVNALNEMFVSSNGRCIKIFDAVVPGLNGGYIKGITTTGGVEVGVEWDKIRYRVEGKGRFIIRLKSKLATDIDLQVPLYLGEIFKSAVPLVCVNGFIQDIKLLPNTAVEIEFRI